MASSARPVHHRHAHGGDEVLLVDAGHVGGGEGADSHEGLVAERYLAGVAQEDIEGEPDDRVDDGLGVDVDLDAVTAEREHQHQHGEAAHDGAAGDPS